MNVWKVLHQVNKQTVVGWFVGAASAVALHYTGESWWMQIFAVLLIRMIFDLFYAWHASITQPSQDEKSIAPSDFSPSTPSR